MSTKKEKCCACSGTESAVCDRKCPCHQSESIEWEEDSWCVSIVAEAMTFARTEPIGKDASHITRKLREKVSQAITTAVAKRELEIAEEVEKIKTYTGGSSVNEKDKRVNKAEVLSILKH